jgi:ABC-type multidrug transport system fused ATPase/permease subunit
MITQQALILAGCMAGLVAAAAVAWLRSRRNAPRDRGLMVSTRVPLQAPVLERGPGRLAFQSVSVSGCLREFSATAEAGTVVALVGPDPLGKSALLALAARLIDPDSGAVRLDGQNLLVHEPGSVRKLVALAATHPGLMARQPNLNVRGAPSVLLIDELGIDCDPDTLAPIDRAITEHTGTVIVATDNLDRVATADTVWHIQAGRLAEMGPPAQLLSVDGPTARLFGLETVTIMDSADVSIS